MDDAQQLLSIINIADIDKPFANKLQYNERLAGYQHVRSITTTQQQINEEILKALETGPTKEYYRYDLYNEFKQLEGTIFTTNPHLFEQ